MSDARGVPADHDLMISPALFDRLGPSDAAIALIDLFAAHERRIFNHDAALLNHLPRWTGRGARQRLARALAALHMQRCLRWLPGNRYQIVSREILTGAEFTAAYPEEAA